MTALEKCQVELKNLKRKHREELDYIEKWLKKRCERDFQFASEDSLYDLHLRVENFQRNL
jgi:hypothetical protein